MKKLTISTAAVLSVALITPNAHAARVGDYSSIAHRGYSKTVTENTIRSFNRAVGHGTSSVEVDVRMTRDRKFVIMHDKSIGRTTRQRGYVDRKTKRHIKRHVRTNDGQRVPFLTDMLSHARKRRTNLVIEIKTDRRKRWSPRDFRRMRNLIHRKGMQYRVRFIAFSKDALRELESVAPHFQTVKISGTYNPTAEMIDNLGVDGLAVWWNRVDEEEARALTDAGYVLIGRNANYKRAWNTYRDMGVSGVITDSTPRYVRWYYE